MATKDPSAAAILNRLVVLIDGSERIQIDGTDVDLHRVREALLSGASLLSIDRQRPPWWPTILRWILFSVVLTVISTVVFKAIGMVASEKLTPAEMGYELLTRGDLLLISSGFALEAVGDLLMAEGKGPARVVLAFACLSLLVISMGVIAMGSYLPVDLHISVNGTVQRSVHQYTTENIESFARTAKLALWLSAPLFALTITGVYFAKKSLFGKE